MIYDVKLIARITNGIHLEKKKYITRIKFSEI